MEIWKILTRLWLRSKVAEANMSEYTRMYYDKDTNTFVAEPHVPLGYPNRGNVLQISKTVAECGCGGMCELHKLPDGWHLCMSYQQAGGEKPTRCTNYVGPNVSFCDTHKITTITSQNTSKQCAYTDCLLYIGHEYKFCVKHSNIVLAEGDPDDEYIDTAYEKKVGATHLKYRQYRKTYDMETVHYKLEVKGKRDDILMFHLICHAADHDYPFDPGRREPTKANGCEKCHGYVWKNAVLLPADIKRAAKQAGVYAKVKQYVTAGKCGGQVKEIAVGMV